PLIPFTGTAVERVSAGKSRQIPLRKDTTSMKDENILDQNKELTRRFYEECWNQGKTERVDQYVAKDCRYRDPVFPSLAPGLESLKRHITMCRSAFPDLR